VRSGLLRAYVEELLAATIAAAGDDATWEHPFVRSVLPGSNAERLRRLISHRERLLDALDVAPAVLTHHDGHRRNILTIDKSVSVLIDWAYAGTGAIGEQLGSLVGMTIMLGEVDAVDMRGATNDAIDAYLGGLSDEGWRGDTSHVRFAAHVACALQAGLITSSLADLTSLDATKDPSLHQLFEEHADHMAGLLDLFLWSAAEAWRLLDRM
jgi:hypothetical protein